MSISVEPWQQGELDLLCGVYAVLNGIKTAAPMHASIKSQWDDIFYAIACKLEDDAASFNILSYGLNRRSLGIALRAAGDWLESNSGSQLFVSWPFYSSPTVKAESVLMRLQDHLSVPNTAAIVCVSGRIDHWTVVTDVTARRVRLFDSIGMKFIRRASIGSFGDETARYQIMPTMTALIQVTAVQ